MAPAAFAIAAVIDLYAAHVAARPLETVDPWDGETVRVVETRAKPTLEYVDPWTGAAIAVKPSLLPRDLDPLTL